MPVTGEFPFLRFSIANARASIRQYSQELILDRSSCQALQIASIHQPLPRGYNDGNISSKLSSWQYPTHSRMRCERWHSRPYNARDSAILRLRQVLSAFNFTRFLSKFETVHYRRSTVTLMPLWRGFIRKHEQYIFATATVWTATAFNDSSYTNIM